MGHLILMGLPACTIMVMASATTVIGIEMVSVILVLFISKARRQFLGAF